MSNKPQELTPQGKVLTTNIGRVIARFTVMLATIALVIGIGVMMFIGFDLHHKAPVLIEKIQEIIEQYLPENGPEEPDEPGEEIPDEPAVNTIDVSEYGIEFKSVKVTYDEAPHKAEVTLKKALPHGVTVSYINNEHTNVGTYLATAIISGGGYDPLVLNTEICIEKAKFSASGVGYNVKFESKLFAYDNAPHSLNVEFSKTELNDKGETVTDEAAAPEGTSVEYNIKNIADAGIYQITATVLNSNYETYTVSATMVIVDLGDLVCFPEANQDDVITRVYTGEEHLIKLDTSRLDALNSKLRSAGLKAITLEIGDAFEDNYLNTYHVNAGEYTINVSLSAKIYETGKAKDDEFTTATANVSVKLLVNKNEIKNVHSDFELTDCVVVYNGGVQNIVSEYANLYVESNPALAALIRTAKATYVDEAGAEVTSVVIPGVYTVKIDIPESQNFKAYSLGGIKFTVEKKNINSFFDEVKVEENTFREGKTFVFEMALSTRSYLLNQPLVIKYTCTHNGEAFGEETVVYTKISDFAAYRDGMYIAALPFEFKDAGEYKVNVEIIDNNCLEANVDLTYNIKYAALDLYGILGLGDDFKIDSEQSAAGFGPHLPKLSKNSSLAQKIKEKLIKEGITLEYLYGDQPTEGFDYFGIYNVKMRFTQGNYRKDVTVKFTVLFNYWLAIIAIAIGAVIGVIVGLIKSITNVSKEKFSQSRFLAPGSAVANARGGIICESFAKSSKNGCTGRLYLSEGALEFYADDYEAAKNNFLIHLDDIRNVDVLSPSQIEVYANREAYVFTVPDGKAAEWAHHIIKA